MFTRGGVLRSFAALLALWTGAGFPAQNARAQSNPPFPIVSAGDSASLEHQDRKARLLRLSRLQGIIPPEFFEYTIPQSQHHLPNYGDLPVLRVVFNERVFFDFNRDNLRPEAAAVLETVAGSLRLEPPDVSVFIAGHTDAVGSVNYNLALGLRRAQAVAVALARRRVNRAQIFLVSFGKAVPIASNDTDAGRAQNRRVEFLFAARPEPVAAWLANQRMMTCAPDKSAKGNDCPSDPHFTITSLSLVDSFKNASLGGNDVVVSPGADVRDFGPTAPSKTIKPGAAPRDIVIGAKTIDIDLRQNVFTMAPPR